MLRGARLPAALQLFLEKSKKCARAGSPALPSAASPGRGWGGVPANGVARDGWRGDGGACGVSRAWWRGTRPPPRSACPSLPWVGDGGVAGGLGRHRCRGDGTEVTGPGGDSMGGGGGTPTSDTVAPSSSVAPRAPTPRTHHPHPPCRQDRGVWGGDPSKSQLRPPDPISQPVAPKPEAGARGGPVTPATLLSGCSPPPGCGRGGFGERCGGAREGAVPAPCLTASAPPNLSVRHGREREGAGGRAGAQGGDGPGTAKGTRVTAKGTRVTAARPCSQQLGEVLSGSGELPRRGFGAGGFASAPVCNSNPGTAPMPPGPVLSSPTPPTHRTSCPHPRG